jgi:molecular chaperone GrpE
MEEKEEIQNISSDISQQMENDEVESLVKEEGVENAKKSGIFGKKDKKSKQSVEQEIEKLKTDNAELQDKFLRLYSEFDNYKKRTQKERLDIIQNAAESMMVNLLPVIDDMERAIKYSENSDADLNSIKEGEILIYQKFSNLLKQKGLKAIDTINTEFDTDYHEAVATIPTDNEEDKGKIVEEIGKGYMLNDKVIRFSKVVIYQ